MNTKTDGPGFDFCAFLDYDKSDEVRLYEIGRYVAKTCYSYGPVIRPRGILHYVTSGKGMLQIMGKEYSIHEQQIFFIPAGISAYYIADSEDPWTYCWAHLGGSAMLELFNECELNEMQPVRDVKLREGETKSALQRLMDDLFENYEREYFSIAKTYELMDFLHSSYARSEEETNESLQLQYVRTVIKFIQLKFSEPIHVEDIAMTCGLNRSYLSRLFHEATGSTIKDFLSTYRVNMAKNMLKKTDNTIQFVAFAVGYSDIFTFSKAFKRITGMSPSEYRSSPDI
ncbi:MULTISPECIES: AraC family transcriptional regulator [unclassified Butyrivibrio]|uniref:AraC family transcriptional regulator n=1 Tax=unclassified Butyrivibrio TaxID=2639466 RepID=UPI0003B43A9A|nr:MULTISPECIES: AraC family transcriptional regulator [unclassified Butyrivibrio]SEL94131.1 AraC-type DNA-binding protein [Butyrivibrio sp. ob235]